MKRENGYGKKWKEISYYILPRNRFMALKLVFTKLDAPGLRVGRTPRSIFVVVCIGFSVTIPYGKNIAQIQTS